MNKRTNAAPMPAVAMGDAASMSPPPSDALWMPNIKPGNGGKSSVARRPNGRAALEHNGFVDNNGGIADQRGVYDYSQMRLYGTYRRGDSVCSTDSGVSMMTMDYSGASGGGSGGGGSHAATTPNGGNIELVGTIRRGLQHHDQGWCDGKYLVFIPKFSFLAVVMLILKVRVCYSTFNNLFCYFKLSFLWDLDV